MPKASALAASDYVRLCQTPDSVPQRNVSKLLFNQLCGIIALTF
jgi:hypothetical protein